MLKLESFEFIGSRMKTKCHCKRMVARSLLSENLSTQPAALPGSTRIFIWGGVHLVQFEPKFFHALGFTGVVAPTEWLNVENTPSHCGCQFKPVTLENANKANSLSQIPNMLKTPKPSSIQHCLALKELNQGRQMLPQREALMDRISSVPRTFPFFGRMLKFHI